MFGTPAALCLSGCRARWGTSIGTTTSGPSLVEVWGGYPELLGTRIRSSFRNTGRNAGVGL